MGAPRSFSPAKLVVAVISSRPDGRAEGAILEILERRSAQVVGQVRLERRGAVVVPFDARLDTGTAAEALGATADQVQSWRTGTAQMAFSEYMVLASMIGVAAAASINGDNARIADISAAAVELGVDLTPRSPATATG